MRSGWSRFHGGGGGDALFERAFVGAAGASERRPGGSARAGRGRSRQRGERDAHVGLAEEYGEFAPVGCQLPAVCVGRGRAARLRGADAGPVTADLIRSAVSLQSAWFLR